MRSCNVFWEDFTNHSRETIRNLYTSQLYSDVTLVVNDGSMIPAHKFVLGSSSSILEKMMTSTLVNNINNSLVFLPTVRQEDLLGVLSFMYFGEAKVSQDKLEGFFRLAADLKINTEGGTAEKEKRSEEIVEAPDPNKDSLEGNIENQSKAYEFPQEVNEKSSNTVAEGDLEDKIDDYDAESYEYIEEEVEKEGMFESSAFSGKEHSKNLNESNYFTNSEIVDNKNTASPIEEINRELKDLESDLLLDTKINLVDSSNVSKSTVDQKNEEVTKEKSKRGRPRADHLSLNIKQRQFECNFCDYKATQSGNLTKHINIDHARMLEQCTQCPYEASKQQLKKHTEKVHNINFPCTLCDFSATTAGNLKKHIEEKHNGTKFPCDKCLYKASTPGHVKFHSNLHCTFCEKLCFGRQEKELHMKEHRHNGF